MNTHRSILRLGLGIALSTALLGCATSSEKLIQPNSNGLEVTFTDEAGKEGLVGFVPSRVRAVIPVVSGGGGAGQSPEDDIVTDCTLKGTHFTASFQSPALINLPSYGSSTAPVEVTCQNDEQRVTKTFEPINLSAAGRNGNAAFAAGLLGPIVGSAVTASNPGSIETDAFGYGHELKLKFKP